MPPGWFLARPSHAARRIMKSSLQKLLRFMESLGSLVQSKSSLARRALLRSETRERNANEAERLDRLRNPGDYRGR